MQFRFLHTADIHLDSPLQGLSGQEGEAARRIRGATREAFDQLVGRAIEEEVAFAVIAGDLYDGDWRDYNTGVFFARQMGRLGRAGIPVYMLYGNHDAESQITKQLQLPDNVHAFRSRRPESFALDALGVVLHGQSYGQRDVTENLVPDYPEPVAGRFNIGVLHTGMGGMGGHANYAPCALAELVAKGYDYWALGHVHQPGVLSEHPHVVFPGNLQGRHVREAGPRGATLVTVEDGAVAELGRIDADVVRWNVLEADVAGATCLSDVVDAMREALGEAVSHAEERLLACRLRLVGRTEMHGNLLMRGEDLHGEAQAAAAELAEEAAWIERVVVDTQPVAAPGTLVAREDALGDLQRMLVEAAQDPELVAALKADIGELTGRLPAEAREGIEDPALQAALDGDWGTVIEQAAPYLLARLTAEED